MSELDFLRKIQRLLDEGEFFATYKYALLQALADLSVERDSELGGTFRVPLAAISEKFIEYYWTQARPYGPGSDTAGVIKQNAGKQAAIINWVIREQSEFSGSLSTLHQQTLRWRQLVKVVSAQVKAMPLWRLQVMGGNVDEFLYRQNKLENGCIELLPGVQQSFRSFHGLITNLVRGAWVTKVRRIGGNQALLGDRGDISEFLFGSERRSLDNYRSILRDYQSSVCFYCGREVRRGGDADHFIPWSRYPVDLGHNFVFSDPTCNNNKRDYLAHPDFLAKWRELNLDHHQELVEMFDEKQLRHDVQRTRHIAWWAYEQGQKSKSHVWKAKDQILLLDNSWRTALTGMLLAAEDRGKYKGDQEPDTFS